MKGGPNTSGAMDVLAFMGNPELQAMWMEAIPYGAASKAAYELVSAETISNSPQHLQTSPCSWKSAPISGSRTLVP